jgi:leucyl aminopeptidase
VRLQVLIPAVENAIAGNAFRPGDVFKTRKGCTSRSATPMPRAASSCATRWPTRRGQARADDRLATLTGRARVALGPQLPALFCRRMDLARELVDRAWRCTTRCGTCRCGGLPRRHRKRHRRHRQHRQGPMAGAITAALFLDDFVPADMDWLHLDLFAWNDTPRPGRPAGGEAQTLRTLGDVLTATATEVSRAGRTGLYDVMVVNQRGVRVAAFRGRSHALAGRKIVASLPTARELQARGEVPPPDSSRPQRPA